MNLSAGTDESLAGHAHAIGRLHARQNHNLVALPLAALHRNHLGGAVRLHDVDELSALADLKCLQRHEDGIFLGLQNQTDVDELARPEMAVGIIQSRAQFDGADSGRGSPVRPRGASVPGVTRSKRRSARNPANEVADHRAGSRWNLSNRQAGTIGL